MDVHTQVAEIGRHVVRVRRATVDRSSRLVDLGERCLCDGDASVVRALLGPDAPAKRDVASRASDTNSPVMKRALTSEPLTGLK